MRLEGHIRCGYYPTPPDVVETLRSHVRFPEEPFAALDPCTGEGDALAAFTAGVNAVRYGIELDRHRAAEAKARLDHVIRGDFFRTRITKRTASLCWLNPPYADGDGVCRNRMPLNNSTAVSTMKCTPSNSNIIRVWATQSVLPSGVDWIGGRNRSIRCLPIIRPHSLKLNGGTDVCAKHRPIGGAISVPASNGSPAAGTRPST